MQRRVTYKLRGPAPAPRVRYKQRAAQPVVSAPPRPAPAAPVRYKLVGAPPRVKVKVVAPVRYKLAGSAPTSSMGQAQGNVLGQSGPSPTSKGQHGPPILIGPGPSPGGGPPTSRAKPRHPPPVLIGPGPSPDSPVKPGRRRAFHFGAFSFGFGRPSAAYLGSLRAAVMRVGLGLVGGDFLGDARGDYSIDLQNKRLDGTQVANGLKAIALGNECTASATAAVAIGLGTTANGVNAVGIGKAASGGANDAVAIGSTSFALGLASNALGQLANARVDKTTVISGPICGQSGQYAVAADWCQQLASADVIIRTGWIDAKVVADYILTMPAGFNPSHFWIGEMGILVNAVSGLTVQPFVHFGTNGTPQKNLANVQTVNLTAVAQRQLYTAPLAAKDGLTSLLFGIATAAVATGLTVSAYWRGILMEG